MTCAKTDMQYKAKELRKQGKSLNYIAKELNVSKGSVSVWVRNVELTQEQMDKLYEYRKRGRVFFSIEEREKKSKYMKQMWKDGRCGKCIDYKTGHLTFNKYEIYAKPYIEERFCCNDFKHEYIEKHFFDFCNEEYIIELTFVPCGVSNAIKRFKNIQYDTRKRVIIGPIYYIGNKRKNQMNELNIEFIPLWFDKLE